MKGILIIYFLTTSSSYTSNKEQLAEDRFDVIEWWITDDKTYRIKTYSLDNDIHIYSIPDLDIEAALELAKTNTDKHYGDIIQRQVILELTGLENNQEIKKKLKDLQLIGELEYSDIVFYNPDGKIYQTLSVPE